MNSQLRITSLAGHERQDTPRLGDQSHTSARLSIERRWKDESDIVGQSMGSPLESVPAPPLLPPFPINEYIVATPIQSTDELGEVKFSCKMEYPSDGLIASLGTGRSLAGT